MGVAPFTQERVSDFNRKIKNIQLSNSTYGQQYDPYKYDPASIIEPILSLATIPLTDEYYRNILLHLITKSPDVVFRLTFEIQEQFDNYISYLALSGVPNEFIINLKQKFTSLPISVLDIYTYMNSAAYNEISKL
jgi:hypothetical protein